MTMLAVQEGWLITEKEAAKMDQQTLEQVLLQRAWAELQAVDSYVEREARVKAKPEAQN